MLQNITTRRGGRAKNQKRRRTIFKVLNIPTKEEEEEEN
jgi:hypothetical protein